VSANTVLDWHDFFMGSLGASAALTGLLFVAISMNLSAILKYPHLPGRAAASLTVLISVLVVSTFALAPGQSMRVLGLEIAVSGALAVLIALLCSTRKRSPSEPLWWTLEPLILLQLPGWALLAGGLSLWAGGGGGFYWVLAGTILAFVVAALNSWVLLVEILR
jgi:hypothetical protein